MTTLVFSAPHPHRQGSMVWYLVGNLGRIKTKFPHTYSRDDTLSSHSTMKIPVRTQHLCASRWTSDGSVGQDMSATRCSSPEKRQWMNKAEDTLWQMGGGQDQQGPRVKSGKCVDRNLISFQTETTSLHWYLGLLDGGRSHHGPWYQTL